MINSRKGFIVPLLMAIIAVLVIGGGVFLYIQNKPQPVFDIQPISTSTNQTAVSSTSNQVANWKVYTNTKYGFKFSYPSDFSNAEEYPNQGQKECKQTDMGRGVTINFVNVANIPNLFQVNVVCGSLQGATATTFETDFSLTLLSYSLNKTVSVAEKPSHEVEFTTPTGYLWKVVQIPLDSSHYVEIGYTFGNADKLNGLTELSGADWTSVLASFKFVTPVSLQTDTNLPSTVGNVVNWQTYTNSQLGFSIKYPPVGSVENVGGNGAGNPNYRFAVGLHSNDGSGGPQPGLYINVVNAVGMHDCGNDYIGRNVTTSNVTINGISFTKGDVSTLNTISNSNSYADEYCTQYNGNIYRLTSILYFPSPTSQNYSLTSTPSRSVLENAADVNYAINSFKFTN